MAQLGILDGELIESADSLDPDLNQAFYDFIDQVKSEANSGGSIAVFEVPRDANGNARPNTLNKPKLFTVPVGSMTFDDICDRVLREFVEPGGSILIQLLGRKDGKRGNLLNQLIPLRRGKASENKTDGSTAGDIERLMRMMDERVARQSAEMRALLEQNRAPIIDPLAQSLAITKQLTEMAVAMSGGRAPGGSPAAQAADPNSMMNQMMQMMMTRMMKKFFDNEDGGERANPTAGILENIRAIAVPLLEGRNTEQQRALIAEKRMLAHQPPAAGHAPKAPTAESPAVQTPVTPTEENLNPPSAGEMNVKLMSLLKEALPTLISIAGTNADPEATARLALKELPESDQELNDAFYALVQEKDFLAQLAVINADVNQHAQWFEEFRAALELEFDPDKLTPAAASAST